MKTTKHKIHLRKFKEFKRWWNYLTDLEKTQVILNKHHITKN